MTHRLVALWNEIEHLELKIYNIEAHLQALQSLGEAEMDRIMAPLKAVGGAPPNKEELPHLKSVLGLKVAEEQRILKRWRKRDRDLPHFIALFQGDEEYGCLEGIEAWPGACILRLGVAPEVAIFLLAGPADARRHFQWRLPGHLRFFWKGTPQFFVNGEHIWRTFSDELVTRVDRPTYEAKKYDPVARLCREKGVTDLYLERLSLEREGVRMKEVSGFTNDLSRREDGGRARDLWAKILKVR